MCLSQSKQEKLFGEVKTEFWWLLEKVNGCWLKIPHKSSGTTHKHLKHVFPSSWYQASISTNVFVFQLSQSANSSCVLWGASCISHSIVCESLRALCCWRPVCVVPWPWADCAGILLAGVCFRVLEMRHRQHLIVRAPGISDTKNWVVLR